MNFGKATSEEESFAIMDRALELGINFFDTANRYGDPAGRTEEIIGRWLAQGGRRREQIVLATKVFGPMGPGANDEGLSAYHIRMACSDSLRRLQTDHVDLYQMHHIDRGLPHFKSTLEYLNGDRNNLSYPSHITPGASWEEIWQQMEQLVLDGKILYVGSSNFAAWNIAQANEKAAVRHFLGLVSEQSIYNLSKRMGELEMVPVCRAYGLGILPWGPLGGGLLAGSLEKAEKGRRANLKLTEHQKKQVREYEALCRELGEEPANIALAWLLHNSVVTAPIIGPRTLEQLEKSIRAIEITLSPEVLARLDEIWPGPGNQAPEAYAW
jgi:aryl-alcohol dehydrogenase-like predicted oxidoreductase